MARCVGQLRLPSPGACAQLVSRRQGVPSQRHGRRSQSATLALLCPRPGRFVGDTAVLVAPSAPRVSRCRRMQAASSPRAMVNVELSPAAYLGVVLIGSGLALLQVRKSRPVLSRDTDIISACVSILAGGILIFQGWRLDPILLFEQLLMASTAVAFGVETLKLRQQLPEATDRDAAAQDPAAALERARRAGLPPPGRTTSTMPYESWAGGAEQQYGQYGGQYGEQYGEQYGQGAGPYGDMAAGQVGPVRDALYNEGDPYAAGPSGRPQYDATYGGAYPAAADEQQQYAGYDGPPPGGAYYAGGSTADRGGWRQGGGGEGGASGGGGVQGGEGGRAGPPKAPYKRDDSAYTSVDDWEV